MLGKNIDEACWTPDRANENVLTETRVISKYGSSG
jgi:hypothetical protein